MAEDRDLLAYRPLAVLGGEDDAAPAALPAGTLSLSGNGEGPG
jgi:hypothetical protein